MVLPLLMSPVVTARGAAIQRGLAGMGRPDYVYCLGVQEGPTRPSLGLNVGPTPGKPGVGRLGRSTQLKPPVLRRVDTVGRSPCRDTRAALWVPCF